VKPLESRYVSHCKTCFEVISVGDLITRESWGWVHFLCQGNSKPLCDAISRYTGFPCQNLPRFGSLCRVHHEMAAHGKVFPRGAAELVCG
jgi:hypothetical protein